MKRNNTHLTVAQTVTGWTYAPFCFGGKALTGVCPCCGKTIGEHDTLVSVDAGSKQATGGKCLVGVGCKPTCDDTTGMDKVVLEYRRRNKSPEYERGLIMMATRNYPAREVKMHSRYIKITLYKAQGQGCQQLGKLPAALHLAQADMKISFDGGKTFKKYDSAEVTDRLGTGYKGRKAYGI